MLVLLVIPGYFVYDRISSYGQNSIVVIDDPMIIGVAEPQTIKLPKDAWFNHSLKSWIYEAPSVRDIIVKDIELTGGWEAMRRRTTLEIKGELYDMSCSTLDGKDFNPNLADIQPDKVTLKAKAPNKYYRLVETPSHGDLDEGTVRAQHYNGKEMYECTVMNSEWSCDLGAPDSTMPTGMIGAATNYSNEFELHNRVKIEEFKNRIVYVIHATAKQLLPGEIGGYRKLRFDTVIGRLVGIEFPNEVYVGFEDFRKVDSVSLPHRFCFDTPYGSKALVVTEWNFAPMLDDGIFERPTQD